jgi:hypothetical protein|nr:MAG TPA: dissimilatory sulfite reductase D [Caudoviricetes sp.]
MKAGIRNINREKGECMEISEETRRQQRASAEEVQVYKELIHEYIHEHGRERLTLLDIAKAVQQPGDKINRPYNVARTMKERGEIDIYNGSRRGFWTTTKVVKEVPTYEKPKKLIDVVKQPSEAKRVPVNKTKNHTISLPGINITINITK